MSKKALISLIALIGGVVLAYGVIRLGWFLPEGGLSRLLAGTAAGGQVAPFVPYLVVLSALVDSINPCAFSVLLLTIAFLFSLGKSRGRVLQAGAAYIFGIFLTYFLIGIGITQVLAIFGVPQFMSKVGAVVLILWAALELLGAIFPKFPIKLKIPQFAHPKMAGLIEKGTLPTAFALGLLVGITEFPCTGGPYLFILGLLHDNATRGAGIWYLLLYNFIFVLPLGVILSIASDRTLLARVQTWKSSNSRAFSFTMGGVMLLLGFLILWF